MVSFTAGAKYFAEKPDDGPIWGMVFEGRLFPITK
jgi:hypothetical protein